MILVSKVVQPLKHFWVEDYTQEDKVFFESIGFEEKKSNIPKGFGGKDMLEFKGTGMFGGMSDDELVWVLNEISTHVSNMGDLKVHKFIPE